MDNQELMNFLSEAAVEIDAAMRLDLAAVESGLLGEILHHGIFNGGKRIRPQLTLLCAGLCDAGKMAKAGILKLALGFEYLHAASLLHDDVIDHAGQRRGKPTANALWEVSLVILAGDYLHSRAMTLAATGGGLEEVAIAGGAVAAMVEAEFLQIRAGEERNTSEENYLRVAAGKTGALIAAACEAGVLAGGGSPQQRQAARLYGESIGPAFQIIDDLLDYQGDPAKTGKAVGNDLVEGKMTLPLIYALQQAAAPDRQLLEGILAADPATRNARFAEARDLIERCGGFTTARRKAAELVDHGLAALAVFREGKERRILAGLAAYILSREK